MATQFELTEDLVKKIQNLVQLDIDATYAYAQAIDGIDAAHGAIKAQLLEFRGDHERHIAELSSVLTSLGHKAPAYARDFKGFLIEGMTAIRSAIGTQQALKAMRQNEVLTNRQYQNALELEALPPTVLEIVRRGREDERRHLMAIEAMIGELSRVGAVRT
jgi:rubrerythrin